ncbi:MBOAT family O-acyltransferase [Limnoglobus roseus]|uniref:MBOAT family O-acyltransferase n=1 Tax=Limnoglobus roseus TaxID=2598579 RepID=UPI0011EAB510|nr:MBOAT family O-acyltransferase [Limnoglobus roseus]
MGSKVFFLFLIVVLLGYHLLRGRPAKYTFLLAASWAFYAICSPYYLWVLLLLTVVDFVVAKKIDAETDERRRKRWLVVSVVSNLGLLFAFKYTAFVWDSGSALVTLFGGDVPPRAWDILLPLGISFHTFQGISYTVDVYRRQIRAVTNLRDYALFVAFFPQMAAGPIVRAVEFLPQMVTPPVPSAEQIRDGIFLFARGLFKKLVIADQLDQLFVSAVFNDPAAFSPVACRWAVLAWAVQIYCDFSGYTDIALGTAKWFGFELPANFHLPYLATSITDFWRRWHLSLSTWLRDYLYFPLGGSRGSTGRTYFNLMAIFVLCGLWHGATWAWLVYGVYNGVLMSVHRAMGSPGRLRSSAAWRMLAWTATFAQLLLGLILIRMTTWADGGTMLAAICGVTDGVRGVPAVVPLLVLLGMAGHGWELLCERLPALKADWEPLRVANAAVSLAAVVVFSPGVGKTFLYIQF